MTGGHASHSLRPEGHPKLLEIRWRLAGPARRVLECGIYQTDEGLELRAGYGAGGMLRTCRAADMATAYRLAEEWRQAVLSIGSFAEITDADDRT